MTGNHVQALDSPEAIKAYLKGLPTRPGVYRMYDKQGHILYVGKARQLKKRVSSYFQKQALDGKTASLVRQIAAIDITVTHTETEALLLENNLIKEHKPRYNILLRDDKSYPYIFLSTAHDFPRFGFHRGAKRERGRYFGPYPGASGVRETLYLLQKLFPVRQCEDSVFNNRSRPCLQYQIKRCSAPCVGYISREAYDQDVRHSVMVLEGRDNQVVDELVMQMERASASQLFEQAAHYRDQISSLRHVQEKQYVSGDLGDTDIIVCDLKATIACIQIFFIRGGRNLGNKTFFPANSGSANATEVLTAFIPQYYLGRDQQLQKDIPQSILINPAIGDAESLANSLSEIAGHKISLHNPMRGDKVRWVEMAVRNLHLALNNKLNSRLNMQKRYEALQDCLGLDQLPERLECFDISHTGGESTVASCVVFNAEGPMKSDYRRFNIKEIAAGDDYAAMRQALERRYKRLMQGEGRLPDILFIDGGKGQVAQALQVLGELQVPGVTIVGVAKGSERRPGLETLILAPANTAITLPADSPALHLIQQIRDEAHRFAITGHRQQRKKSRGKSLLEEIDGLGAKRRALLIKQFGGLQEIARAGVEDLARVSGISMELAQRIYDTLHDD